MTVGRLLQNYVLVDWGETRLTPYVGTDAPPEILAQTVKFSLDKEGKAGNASFALTPNPVGFQVFTELKANALTEPVTVTVGYVNGSAFTQSFRFTGVQLTTGVDPKLEIQLVAGPKGPWTDKRISYTMEDEITLKELPEFLKEKLGPAAQNLNFEFVGNTAKDAEKIKIRGNQIGQTAQVILTDYTRAHGMEVDVQDMPNGEVIVISYPPNKEGELEVDKPVVEGEAQPAQRKVYIVGPGLMRDITRKQTFDVGFDSTENAASPKEPVTKQTVSEEVVQPQDPVVQTESVTPNTTIGSEGQPAESPSSSAQPEKEDETTSDEARQAKAALGSTSCDMQFVMVPYVVGIKPRDIVVVPSIRGLGEYLEDWEVKTVSYNQDDSGQVNISLTGQRPFTGEETMLDDASQEAVRGVCAKLTTPDKWNEFYWSGGKVQEETTAPLAG